jgi:Zn-dependent protease
VGGGGNAVLAAMDVTRGGAAGWDASALPLFPVAMLLYYGVTINLLLFVFNLIPIPPLDGSHVLRQFLPYEVERIYNRIGMIGLIVIFFFGGSLIFGTFYYPLLGVFDRLLGSL